MHPVLFQLGVITVHSYGALYLVAYVISGTLAGAEARRLGHSPFAILGAIVIGVTGAVITGRLLAFAIATLFGDAPGAAEVFRSGTTYLGAILGFLAAVGLYSLALRAWRPSAPPLRHTLDILATVVPLGHGIGRVGCFLAGCCYGAPAAGFPGVTYSTPGIPAPLGIPLHPTQLYEAAGELVLFAVLWGLRRRKRFEGQLILIYLVGYAALRFVVEFFRGDTGPAVAGLGVRQLLCLLLGALAATGLAAGVWWSRRPDGARS